MLITRLFAELVGTFILLFAVGVSGGEPFAVGGSLLCGMVVTGFVSGAQFNPAITLGIIVFRFLDKTLTKPDLIELLLNMVMQFVGLFSGPFWAGQCFPTPYISISLTGTWTQRPSLEKCSTLCCWYPMHS